MKVEEYVVGQVHDLSDKVSFLISLVSDNFSGKFFFFSIVSMVVALILSIAAGAMLSYILEKRPPSFILLTTKSIGEKKKIESKIMAKKIGFAITIIVSFFINIMSSVFYDKFIK